MKNYLAGHLKGFFMRRASQGMLVVTGLLFTLAMAVLFVFQPFFLRLIDLKVYDTMFRSTYSDQISEGVVIVDLDEESLAEFGQWPWPRYRVALLLEKIRRAGPLSIGLDMVFAEEDRTSPRIIRGQLEKELGVFIDFTGLPAGLEDNDAILAGILEKGPFALGYYFDPQVSASGPADNMSDSATLDSLQIAVLGGKKAQPLDRSLFKASRIINNIPILSAAASGSGFMNVAPDSDGIIRRVPLIMHYNGDVYPSLALSVMLNALDSKQTVIRTNSQGVESLRLGGLTIPLDSRGQMLLNYRGPSRTVKYISAGDILQDALEPGLLSGKIVFLGTSSAGLKDIRTTPIDPVYPGVEAQATVVDNILSGDFLSRPAWASGLELSLVVLMGLVTTFFMVLLGALWVIAPLALSGLGIWFGALHLLESNGLYISPFMPLITLAGSFSVLTFQKFWVEEREKRKIKFSFEHYLSPQVVKRVIKNPALLKLGGEKKNVSILFSDIRNFTRISESMEPQELVSFMNDYLTAMTEIILKNGGTLDKYMGDAIMAFFGAPEDMPDHARITTHTAVEMLNKMYDCRGRWCFPGFDRVEIGVGISSGPVIVGNMGSEKRLNYTVMGDQVNLASRLEGLTKEYGVKILVSQFTREQTGQGFTFREIDLVRVKGREKPVAVYEPVDKDYFTGGKFAYIPLFEHGLAAYRRQNWDEAVDLFNRVLLMKPQDKPSLIYIDRCKQMIRNSPGLEWDGVWIMETK